MKKILLSIIRLYQMVFSFLPPRCRFTPTCSQYMYEAIEKFGVIKGVYIGTKRILKCHPFHEGGHDPLPR